MASIAAGPAKESGILPTWFRQLTSLWQDMAEAAALPDA